MKAIILAAGRGTRMSDLTDNLPKPMLKVGDKNLLEYKLEALPKEVDEIIFVVGYLKEKIKEYFGNNYGSFKINYVEQEILNGSFGAVKICRDLLKYDESFFVLMGDDIYNKEDLQKMYFLHEKENYENIILLTEDSEKYGGKILIDENYFVTGIDEGLSKKGSGKKMINTGAYILNKNVIDLIPILVKKDEYGLPQSLVEEVLANKNFKIKSIVTENWINITDKESLKIAYSQLCKK